MTIRLTDKADMALLYDIDILRYNREVMEKLGYTKQRFIEIFDNRPSIGFEVDGKPIGGMLFDGKESHLIVHSDYHGRWAILWKHALNWIFSLQDPIYQRVERNNTKCLRFMDKNNWKRIKTDDKFVTFEMSSKTSKYYNRTKKISAPDKSAAVDAA